MQLVSGLQFSHNFQYQNLLALKSTQLNIVFLFQYAAQYPAIFS